MAELRPAAVEVEDPVVLLDGFPALTGGQLMVRAGECVLVVGANGAGKSTLLRLVAGLVPLARGRISVLGHDVGVDRRLHRRHVAYLGHEAGLYGDLSVRSNLDFFLGLSEAGFTGESALGAFGLRALADVPVVRLSAGQRQRCALAVAFGRRPRLLLLDEPHAALDAESREEVDAALLRHHQGGGTTLVVSHDPNALWWADRHVVVDAGSIR